MSSLLPRPETLLRGSAIWSAANRPPSTDAVHANGRPATRERRELVLQLARENRGYRHIHGEALKLGFRISNMGVAKILRSRRIPPAPRRSQTTWHQLVRHHASQMLATDSFMVETTWLQRLHVMFFIETASRKVHLGGITASPTGQWVAQQARNLAWKLQEGTLQAKFLLGDCDGKFTANFNHVFRSEGVEVSRLPYRAPRGEVDRGEVRWHVLQWRALPHADP